MARLLAAPRLVCLWAVPRLAWHRRAVRLLVCPWATVARLLVCLRRVCLRRVCLPALAVPRLAFLCRFRA